MVQYLATTSSTSPLANDNKIYFLKPGIMPGFLLTLENFMPRKKKSELLSWSERRRLWESQGTREGSCVYCFYEGHVKNYGIRESGRLMDRCFVCDHLRGTMTLPGQLAFCTNLVLEEIALLRRDLDLAVTSYERVARRARK